MDNSKEFSGPIFIVGMPRSGTKLLRDILNNHSQIAITSNESHVIPYFYRKMDNYGDLKVRKHFNRFYKDFTNTVFYKRVSEKEKFIDEELWYDSVEEWTYAGVLETFFKIYAKSKNKRLWGDKTPFYLVILPLLKQLFPGAKFIHIIRDVRDYCLSLNKGWRKNIYRAAQRWYDAVDKCRKDSTKLSKSQYIEVKYEDLIDSPERTLRSIFNFLNVAYEDEVLVIQHHTENFGDAKNTIGILEKNYGKWKKAFAKKTINKIEKICSPLLLDLGYPVSYSDAPQRLGKFKMLIFQIIDGFNLLRFQIANYRLKEGLSNFFESKRYLHDRSIEENSY